MELSDDGINGLITGKQRADLERIAFGRTRTREDEDAAAAARKKLAEADRAAKMAAVRNAELATSAAAQKVVPAQEFGAGNWNLAPTPLQDELPAPPPPEGPGRAVGRIHSAWLAPIIAGSIAAGYFGASIAGAGTLPASLNATPSPSDRPSIVRLAPPDPVHEPGNLKEADAWFEVPQREVDGFVLPDMLQQTEIDPSAVRFVQTDAAGFSAWVAKNHNGDLCVLGTDGSGGGVSGCVPRNNFVLSGAMVSQDGHTITWNGSTVTVTNPRSQIAP